MSVSARVRLPLALLQRVRSAPHWRGPAVGLLSVAVALSVSQHNSVQLDTNETPYGLYMWGFNRHGNVPFCRQLDVSTPVMVRFFNDKGVRSIHFAEKYAAAIDGNGDLYMWGEAVPGSLVHDLDADMMSEPASELDAIDTSTEHTVARHPSDETATLSKRRTTELATGDMYQPRLVATPHNFRHVACGLDTAYALDDLGHVYAVRPSLLPLEKDTEVELPRMMKPPNETDLDPIVHIDCGDSHLVCLSSAGKVYTAPLNNSGNKHGQLGLGHFKNLCSGLEDNEISTLLQLVPGLAHQIVTHAACGSNHTVILCASGEVYGFGSDRNHQLGLGVWNSQKPSCRHSPTYMSGLWPPGTWTGEKRVTALAAGGDNTVLVLEGNNKTEVLACGYGVHGTLGNATWPHYNGTPTKVKNICDHSWYNEETKTVQSVCVHKITCGTAHCAAVLDTRYSPSGGLDVYAWGFNKHYQLGNRKRSNTAEPIPVAAITKKTRRLQLSHKNDDHAERTIVCARNNTAVFTPYIPTEDLELDMGRRNSERTRRLADEWKLQVLQSQLSEIRTDRDRLKREFDSKLSSNLEKETDLLGRISQLERNTAKTEEGGA